MKLLTPADYRSMPWKNGAGTTTEIAVYPEHAQLDDFVWRVSRAQVVADGGFSHFAGIDRSLALLQGEGLVLTLDEVSQQVDQKNNIVSFAGDVAARARLIRGSISDFNLMSRRSVCRHQLSHWTGAATRALPTETALLYCAVGKGAINTNQSGIELQADEAVLFSASDKLSDYLLHSDEYSRFYCVQIHGKNI